MGFPIVVKEVPCNCPNAETPTLSVALLRNTDCKDPGEGLPDETQSDATPGHASGVISRPPSISRDWTAGRRERIRRRCNFVVNSTCEDVHLMETSNCHAIRWRRRESCGRQEATEKIGRRKSIGRLLGHSAEPLLRSSINLAALCPCLSSSLEIAFFTLKSIQIIITAPVKAARKRRDPAERAAMALTAHSFAADTCTAHYHQHEPAGILP